jgi:hypothetical protein
MMISRTRKIQKRIEV